MAIGSELDKQIYKEGYPTWGCKSGVLDVEDVKDFIEDLKNNLVDLFDVYEIKIGNEGSEMSVRKHEVSRMIKSEIDKLTGFASSEISD